MSVRSAAFVVLLIALAACSPVDKVFNAHQAECLTCDYAEAMAMCVDGLDNDEDLLLDCDDPDCAGHSVCAAPRGAEDTTEVCRDTVDNDGDGQTDCADVECHETEACKPEPKQDTEGLDLLCIDTLDNDHDGLFDCDDPDCLADGITVCEASDLRCSDGLDNDEDGHTDCHDPGCGQNSAVSVCGGTPGG